MSAHLPGRVQLTIGEMPDQTPAEALAWFASQVRMTISTVDDVNAAMQLCAANYTEFTKRIVFIMFGRVFDAHVYSTSLFLEKLGEAGIPVDAQVVEELRRPERLIDRIKTSFKEVARVRPDLSAPDFGTAGWAAVVRALKVRRRLVHPKCEADLTIDEVDVVAVRVGMEWLDAAFMRAPARPS